MARVRESIAFVAYETPFAPCGGIAAVIGRLPGYVQKASREDVAVISPFHHQLVRCATVPAGSFVVRYDDRDVHVNLLVHEDTAKWSWPWYFVEPADRTFFAGSPNPYVVGSTQAEIADNLLRDSLLFGVCVSRALPSIDAHARWTVMMQDWEAATAALALADRRDDFKMFITLHNSYDSRAEASHLERAGIDASACPPYRHPEQGIVNTVLARALPLVRRTVFTVSEQFALDLVGDRLQTEVMARHLQPLLKGRLLGVNNGPFADLVPDRVMLERARHGNPEDLRKWKSENRHLAMDALRTFDPSGSMPIWGNRSTFDPGDDSTCWFVMAGRDDTRQKGYDVAVAAVDAFLRNGGDARFFFFPIPGDEGLAGLSFLKELARTFSKSVLVFPFRWAEGFGATLQGATYGIMPSLYEPFGMANEFYLKGTVGIGRATGGIVQQIAPHWADASFSYAAELRAGRWHAESTHATGILFRETDQIESAAADWAAINRADYTVVNGTSTRLENRKNIRLFNSMVYELSLAIEDGIRISTDESGLYDRMLIEGIDLIQNTFSWERSAQEYYRNVR